jgi:DNA-binding response OmpR family regulator
MWFLKPSILIIDDDCSLGYLMKVNLSKDNRYNVFYTDNGVDGINLLKQKTPSLIILDWVMPRLSGIDVLKSIKENHKTAKTPVIMLTGKNLIGDIENAFLHGADDYLVKPIEFNRLRNKVEDLLRNK